MVVGNGFHEIWTRSNATMVHVFGQYRRAGISLVFIEETALSTEQIRAAGWNTYHAGFRWIHEVSGQFLR